MRISIRYCCLAVMLWGATNAKAQMRVNSTIRPQEQRHKISPYIYGTNDNYPHAGARRLGGNRITSYNWENNASNAGVDYIHHSDDYVPSQQGVPESDYNKPGAAIASFHNTSLSMGAYSLVTLPMAGYVAKDKNGTVTDDQAAPSSRWSITKVRKNRPFSLSPDVTDDTVYVDESLNFLHHTFGKSNTARGIKGYALDNEPCLWFHTHPLLFGSEHVSVKYLMDHSFELAERIKEMDPTAEVFGPALYGFTAYQNLQFAPDWDNVKGNHSLFIEYYLTEMRKKEMQPGGKRLLDVLDLHWYPEFNSTYNASPFNNRNDRASVGARLEMTRSLWDSTYVENTWIGREYNSTILPLLPKLREIINNNYPGTKLAITEYSYMGLDHVSGAIAQADALGIFGKENLYMATYWGAVERYIKSGFDIFRNYDGKGAKFPETSVAAETDNRASTSVYAAVDENDNTKLNVVALNRHQDSAITIRFEVADNSVQYNSARVWLVDQKSMAVRQAKNVRKINGNTFEYTLPAMTIYHFVLTTEDLYIHPFIDTVKTNATMGYSDGNAVLKIDATILDGDDNLQQVTVDLSSIGGSATAPMIRTGNEFTLSHKIPAKYPSGLKSLLLKATDVDGHTATETIFYRVIKKMSPVVIWDGDVIPGGSPHIFADSKDSHLGELKLERIEAGGNKKPGNLSMHFAHDYGAWNLFAWRFNDNISTLKDFTEYGSLEFYIKSDAPAGADIEVSLRDATVNMSTSASVLLKAGGYITSFSNEKFTKVKIPFDVLFNGTNVDLSKIWQINFSVNSAITPFNVWVDDIALNPYTNSAVQPMFTKVAISPAAGYADNLSVITLTAEATDPDNNIKSVTADLSTLNNVNNKALTLVNGVYTTTFKVPVTVANGEKKITLTVTDKEYNAHDTALFYKVYAKAGSEVVWDGDVVDRTTRWVGNNTTFATVSDTGGVQAPKSMKMTLKHTLEDNWAAVVLDWNESVPETRILDFSEKRYLNFWMRTTNVPEHFELEVFLKDQNITPSSSVRLKGDGYITDFSDKYQLVRIPLEKLNMAEDFEISKVVRLGFLTTKAYQDVHIWVDDITVSGSNVADVMISKTNAACAVNGKIRVDSIIGGTGNYVYYINGRLNPSGASNPEFKSLRTGSYDVMIKGDSDFVYMEKVVIGGNDGIKLALAADTLGNVRSTMTGGSGGFSYNWSNGETTKDLANAYSGTYKLIVTDTASGCTATASVKVNNIVTAFNMYPVPATSYVTVDLSAMPVNSKPVMIQIIDRYNNVVKVMNTVMKTKTINIPLTNIGAGIYYMVIDKDGVRYSRTFLVN